MAEFNPDEFLATSSFNPDEFLASGQQAPTEPADNIDVSAIPGETDMARPKPERSLGEMAQGVGEAALTTATGATGGALGFLGGSLEGIAKNLMGDITQEEAMQIAQQRASQFTYEPRGEEGKEIVKDIGETLSVLPPVMGVGVTPKFAMTNSPLGKKIADTGSERIKKDFTKKLGDDRFTSQTFGRVKEARKQGFDDGMTTMIANSPAVDKSKFSKMIKVMEAGKGTVESHRYGPFVGDIMAVACGIHSSGQIHAVRETTTTSIPPSTPFVSPGKCWQP